MKKLFVFAAAALLLVACGQRGQKPATGQSADSISVKSSSAIDVDTLLSMAEGLVNQPVAVEGFVTHTCKHSGRRCFITGDKQVYSIRVEAKGDIGGFNRELIGSHLLINGTLKERRLTQSEIQSIEADVNERLGKDGDKESCESELASISKMRDWMKAHDKDYYATYWIDGTSYEVLD